MTRRIETHFFGDDVGTLMLHGGSEAPSLLFPGNASVVFFSLAGMCASMFATLRSLSNTTGAPAPVSSASISVRPPHMPYFSKWKAEKGVFFFVGRL